MNYSKNLLRSDLDGTLFDNDCKVFDVYKDAIKQFVKHSGRFGVSTKDPG